MNPSGVDRLFSFESLTAMRDAVLSPWRPSLDRLNAAYIFGAKQLGTRAFECCSAAGIDIRGFIDNDRKKQGRRFLDREIFALEALVKEKNAALIIASTTHLAEIITQVRKAGFTCAIPYPLLCVFDETRFSAEPSYSGMLNDLFEHRDHYRNFHRSLADDRSRQTLDGLIDFRLTLETDTLMGIQCPPSMIYFDTAVMPLSRHEVFVDAGAYNGDSAEQFIKAVEGRYKKIVLFEPDQKLIEEARSRLGANERILFNAKGLHSSATVLRFNASGGLDGSLDKAGAAEVPVVPLDDIVHEAISYVKYDVEGGEMEALLGSSRHISCDNPKLAVSVYHRTGDIWRLPELVSTMNRKYRWLLRHYSRTFFDTVAYALPFEVSPERIEENNK